MNRTRAGVAKGRVGVSNDIMGPDGYRTALLFQASMPELRNAPRFPRLCARLGLVEFWLASVIWRPTESEAAAPAGPTRPCRTSEGTP
jgi:hypothetical protein